MHRIESGGQHDEPSAGLLRERGNGRFEIISGSMKGHARHGEAKSRRHGLDCAPYSTKSLKGWIRNPSHPLETGRDLFQQLKPLAADFRFKRTEPGNVATGAGETLDVTGTDRINNRNKHDRDRTRHCTKGCHRRRPVSQNDVWLQGYQFRCERACAVYVARAPAILHRNIAALYPTQPPKSLPKRNDTRLCFWIAFSIDQHHADAPHALGLLRIRCKRPRSRRAADKQDELAPPHCFPRGLGQGIISPQTSTLKGARRGFRHGSLSGQPFPRWVNRVDSAMSEPRPLCAQ